jgi:hypothetical protein
MHSVRANVFLSSSSSLNPANIGLDVHHGCNGATSGHLSRCGLFFIVLHGFFRPTLWLCTFRIPKQRHDLDFAVHKDQAHDISLRQLAQTLPFAC